MIIVRFFLPTVFIFFVCYLVLKGKRKRQTCVPAHVHDPPPTHNPPPPTQSHHMEGGEVSDLWGQ